MPTDEALAATWTHRAYFKQYRLNVEQYGEILIAHAFRGEKKGDSQPCYDVEATAHNVRLGLLETGAARPLIDSCLSPSEGGTVRIEVKCKLAYSPGGKATVIHCRNKLKGVRNHLAATHFAVVLFDGEGNGTAAEAWFFRADIAEQLQRKETKSGYIPVVAVRKAASQGIDGIIDIRNLVERVASSVLSVTR